MLYPRRFEEIKSAQQLPSPSEVAARVLRLADDEDAGASDIAKALQGDPALAGRILKYANSAYVGATRPVVAVQDAVSRLGIRTVRQLALGFTLVAQYTRGASRHFNYRRYWARSLATAISAQILGRATRIGDGDELFIWGLLSDVGELGLATLHPEAYDELLTCIEGLPWSEQLRCQRQQFAMSQVDLTVAMLAEWGIPELYLAAIRIAGHGDRGEAEGSQALQLSHILQAARGIADYCTTEGESRREAGLHLLELAARIELDPNALSLLADQASQGWLEWSRIFELSASPVPSLAGMVGKQVPSAASYLSCVLIVSPDPEGLAQLVSLTQAEGMGVLSATDSETALRLALETCPAVLMIDHRPPQLDGLDLCRVLRRSGPGQRVHVILLTTNQDEEAIAALDGGADDYGVRPWNPRLLAARLRAGLRAAQLQQALETEREDARKSAASLAVANRQLEQLALTDSLTGLPNRAFARETLLSAWAASVRENRPLCGIMIDIDHFKRVNDTYGHDVGDLVLQWAATMFRNAVRASDFVCRMGGEEFLVLCQNTTIAEGVLVADRLRETIANGRIHAPGFDGTITVSVGVAERSPSLRHPDELLREADQALYAAKRGGRNRVVTASNTSKQCVAVS